MNRADRLYPLWLAGCLCAGLAALPVLPADAGGTSQGRVSASVTGGAGTAYGDSHTILGLGVGIYVLDGLQLGLDVEAWFGGDRDVYRVSPEARYVLDPGGPWRPYAGGYYRHTFVEDRDDFASVGGRVGVLVETGRNVHLGAGLVYDVMLDCDSEFTSSCTQVYPEFRVSFTF